MKTNSMNFFCARRPIIFFIVLSFLSVPLACAMKGYRIDISASGPGELLILLRKQLDQQGFELNPNPDGLNSEKGGRIERYQKDFHNIQRSFFDRNADYSVHVDVIYRNIQSNDNPQCEVEVFIYNVYVGNDPKMKPTLVKAADSIESLLRSGIPGILIHRSERLTGIPLI